jgi:hypothetical protein
MSTYHGVSPSAFEAHLVPRHETDAVRHLFRVAASLDSLVVGEPQILGQVKAAYMAAREAGRTGAVFHHLFDRALSVGKTVRHETGINDHAVSVSYAAVELAKKIFETLQQRTVMVLGAGQTSELAARHLVRQGVATVFVANRTHERAVRLAQTLQAKAIPWDSMAEHLAHLHDDRVRVAVGHQPGERAAAGHPEAPGVVDDDEVDAAGLLALGREARAGAGADDHAAGVQRRAQPRARLVARHVAASFT